MECGFRVWWCLGKEWVKRWTLCNGMEAGEEEGSSGGEEWRRGLGRRGRESACVAWKVEGGRVVVEAVAGGMGMGRTWGWIWG